ncbi:MAG: GH1 family beta-glucosidase [Treponema sp.]|nr:GH1 family beta-glucosidase [Treponema sp.]
MEKYTFPGDFVWGSATASYQVEGAIREGGRGESIWDTFARKPGAVYAGENGDVACDHYHRYAEDIALMAEIGLKSYRFSIAWPRIIPDGTGKVNPEGIAFYRKLCEELRKYNIAACATLYHWDLPQPLEDAGGWADRSILSAFETYAKVCFQELGDMVDTWITINEPYCIAYHGYLRGFHAPGHRDTNKALAAVHHLNMAHGIAVREYRKLGLQAPIGITWNLVTPRPATASAADAKAVTYAMAFDTDVFTLPCLGRGYPELVTKDLQYSFPVKDGDFEAIAQPIDFIGINYYAESPVAADDSAPHKFTYKPSWHEVTAMGWPIVPGGLERQLIWLADLTKGAFGKAEIPIYITENGCAYNDEVSADGKVHDRKRIEYLQQHLAVCANVIQKGIPLKGYYVWSLLDNFEWSYGYTKRFGIIHVDYKTQKRTPKDSAYFLRDVIAGFAEW